MNEPENTREALRGLLESTIKAIVDRQDQVDIRIRQGDQTTVYEIHASPDDLGKILGKKGSMVQAIRRIVTAVSCRHRFRAVVEVIE